MIKKNIFTILVALIIMYLSLANSDTFDKIPLVDVPDFDKVVHLVMYFSLMSVIILENRKTIKKPLSLFLIGIIPFLYGILMEILQATITISRSGSFYDALADAAGVLLSILVWLLIKWVKNIK
jgi:VanZ family protein